MTDRPRQLALAGIVGPAAFALAAMAGAPLEDGYSHVHDYISELAAEGSGARVVMTVGFFVFGASILVFAWSMQRLRPAATALAIVVALSGVGTLMAGTFSCDHGCPTTGDRSLHQQLHDLTSVIAFSSWTIAPFVAAWLFRRTRFGRLSIVLGTIAIALGLLSAWYRDRQPDDPVGVVQRTLLLVIAAWFVLATIEIRREG